MAKSQIRWSGQDEKELRLSVRNWNQNIRRRLERDPAAIEYLPAKRTMKEERVKAQAGTRREFVQQTKSIRAFGKPTAAEKVVTPGGVTTTKWQLAEAKKLQKRVNLRAAANRRKYDTDYKKGLDDPEIQALGRKKEVVWELQKPSEFRRQMEKMEKKLSLAYEMEGYEQYKKNYIKSLNDNLGEFAETLINAVNKIPAQALFDFTNKNAETKIEFIYGGIQAQSKFNRIAEHFIDAGWPVADYDETLDDDLEW